MSIQNNKSNKWTIFLMNIFLGSFTSEIIKLLVMRFLGEIPLKAMDLNGKIQISKCNYSL